MTEQVDRPFFIAGGMDADLEELLLDAGGVFWPEPLQEPGPDPAGPCVWLVFGPGRGEDADLARRVCVDHDWPSQRVVDGPRTEVRVQEVVAVRLLAMLAKRRPEPDAVRVQDGDLLPAQLHGLREALPPGARLEVAGRADPTRGRPDEAG